MRWGVLSTSSFAEEKFIPGLKKSPMIEVAAVASRDHPRATDYAALANEVLGAVDVGTAPTPAAAPAANPTPVAA